MAQSVALDQWRGVALLLVLVSHGFYFTDRVHGAGRVGVNLFFFISGLLVYRSLANHGDGGDFWWRRAKRLCPALAAYVVLMFGVTLLLGDAAGFREAAPAALLFSVNYWPAPPPSLAHLWSVACEMQFYAVAPLVFLLGRRRPALWLALLTLLAGFGALAPVLDPAGADKYHYEYAVWPMMLGFCCEHWKARLSQLPAAMLIRLGLVVFAASLALMPLGIETKQLVIAGGSLSLVPCLLAYLSGHELGGRTGAVLTWLGRRTYSIYLWQQPLTICGYLPAAFHPLGAVASTLVGALSFRLFEKPFLSARRRQVADDSPEVTVRVPRVMTVGLVAAGALALPAGAAAPPGLIVFARTVGSHQELFSIRPDGSGLRRLTHDRRHEAEPALSPDGRLIAAVGGPGIVIRTRTGRLVRRITSRGDSQLTELSWSPGGRWIAFLAERCQSDEGGGDPSPLCADLWLVRPSGRTRRRLVAANVYTNDLGTNYTWSPNGRSIVFERFQPAGLAIVDARTSAIRALRGTARLGGDPAWSRAGWIVFTRQRGPFRGSDLYAVRPTGRGLQRICRAEHAERPVSSRDGKQIAFLDFRPTRGLNLWHVRVVPTLGGRCRQVGTATEEWTLAWSPDGQRLLWENFGERLDVGRADGRGRPRVLARGSHADWR